MSNIKIVRQYNVGSENRGFVLDHIALFVDEHPAGYITVENIPQSNMSLFYPQGAYDFKRQIGGWCVDEDIMGYNGRYDYGRNIRIKNEEFQKLSKEERIKVINKGFKKEFEHFKAFHVDRPFTSYINVYGEHDRYKYYDLPVMKTLPSGKQLLIEQKDFEDRYIDGQKNPSWRGRGLGTVLYMEAAIMLAERGLSLHKSGCITDLASHRWDRIQEQYPEQITIQPQKANPKKTDIILSGEGMERTFYPDWVSSVELHENGNIIDITPGQSNTMGM